MPAIHAVFSSFLADLLARESTIPLLLTVRTDMDPTSGTQGCHDVLSGRMMDVDFPVVYPIGTQVSCLAESGRIHVLSANIPEKKD